MLSPRTTYVLEFDRKREIWTVVPLLTRRNRLDVDEQLRMRVPEPAWMTRLYPENL